MAAKQQNFMSRAGATDLAFRIEQHWKSCGHHSVVATVERVYVPVAHKNGEGPTSEPIFAVRSNLVRGLPPKGATS